MLYVLRVSLPDVPGTLGSVATVLSRSGADILSVQVVDREHRHAVDEICVSVEGVLAKHLRESVEEVPGVVVETVRRTTSVPDPLGPLEMADRLARGDGPPIELLVSGLPDALSAAWAIALDAGADSLAVLHATGDAPTPGVMHAPWLPLVGARRIEISDAMPPRFKLHRYELAAAPLDDPRRFVMAGRPVGMRWRTTELRQLELLADMAVRAEQRAHSTV